MAPHVLLLSPYDAVSQAAWRRGLVAALPEYRWTVLTMPPRHFAWRLRGNALGYAWDAALEAALGDGVDLLIATGSTDVSALKGLRPALARLPTLLYLHDNQFAYPQGHPDEPSRVFLQSVSLYAALASDCLVFNSDYNRDTFLAGASGFLRKMPDRVPTGVVERLASRATVLPVPVDDDVRPRTGDVRDDRVPHVVWNHRWEYDKAPARFFDALRRVRAAGRDFRLSLLGQRFSRVPDCFAEALDAFSEVLVHPAPLPRAAYLEVLRQADVAVSTSLHEFQGIAMLEAAASGCVALAPRRLAYPAYLPAAWLYEGSAAEAERDAAACAERLIDVLDNLNQARQVSVQVPRWSTLANRYREQIEQCLAGVVPATAQ